MVYRITVLPSRRAVDRLAININRIYSESLKDVHGNPVLLDVLVPVVSVHPRWKVHDVHFKYDLYRRGVWERDLEGGGPVDVLDLDTMLDLRAYDFDYDSAIGGHTTRSLTYFEITFEHANTGKLIVTETFPKKIIVSNGKVTIDR